MDTQIQQVLLIEGRRSRRGGGREGLDKKVGKKSFGEEEEPSSKSAKLEKDGGSDPSDLSI